MRLFNVAEPSFRPAQHSPARFTLWASLYTAAVVALFALPEATFIWVMLSSLGAITGGRPADPDRGFTPRSFLATIVLAAVAVVAFGFAVWLPRSTVPSAAAPRLVPMWLRLLLGLGWIILFVREFIAFRRTHQPVAAA